MKAEDIELIRDTYNKAYEKGKKAGEKKVVEWSKELCPHGVTRHTKSYAKRDCSECWQEFLKSEGIV